MEEEVPLWHTLKRDTIYPKSTYTTGSLLRSLSTKKQTDVSDIIALFHTEEAEEKKMLEKNRQDEKMMKEREEKLEDERFYAISKGKKASNKNQHRAAVKRVPSIKNWFRSNKV
jgi:hypothetical protein